MIIEKSEGPTYKPPIQQILNTIDSRTRVELIQEVDACVLTLVEKEEKRKRKRKKQNERVTIEL